MLLFDRYVSSRKFAAASCLWMSCLWLASASLSADDFLLKDGERVVLLGSTLIEREQTFGDWELSLTLAAEDRKLVFRNLGWSGDTVWAESRGMFDPPRVGYQRMLDLLKELKPTTIILGYGSVESQRGPEGLTEFAAQYQKLRADLLALDARLIHLAPPLLEAETFPEHSPTATDYIAKSNEFLTQYANEIRSIAESADEQFIDLQPAQKKSELPWTANGIQLSEYGYAESAGLIVKDLNGKPHAIHDVNNTQDTHDAELVAELKAAIIRKNELFFHRWRPQNFTYLLGFRKHEQGQNAVEIAQFDPIVAELEQRIHALQLELNE